MREVLNGMRPKRPEGPTAREMERNAKATLALAQEIALLLSDCVTEEDVLANLMLADVWVAGGDRDPYPLVTWVHKVLPYAFDDVNLIVEFGKQPQLELQVGQSLIYVRLPYLLTTIARYADGPGLHQLVSNPADFGFEYIDGGWSPVPAPKVVG